MNQTKKIIFFSLIGISILGIPLLAVGILNTAISLKYETQDPSECISLVTGADLCLRINLQIGLLFCCLISTVLLLVFRKRFF